MCIRKVRPGLGRLRITFLGLIGAGGCGLDLPPDTLPGTVIDEADSTYDLTADNDMFEQADYAGLDGGSLLVKGYIEDPDDVDVYDLGLVETGDRIIVYMDAGNSLRGAIGLFDADGTSLLVNDHRNVYLGKTTPFVDVIIQHDTDACYVVVSATPGYESTGEYSLVASKTRVEELPEPRPDVILLDFQGADNVHIGTRLPVDVPPFDAANIGGVFEGGTEEIMATIVAAVREDFVGFDVTILSTSEGNRYEEGMSRLYFGSFDESLLGVSDSVDEFNATQSQEAVIFTDTFSAFVPLDPSLDEIAQALANVTSHEVGHLLGLVHTSDPTGIMDITAGLSQLMRDQVFSRSPIHNDVFPIGSQDAVWSLFDTTGGDIDIALRERPASDQKTSIARRELAGPSARDYMRLSTCGLGAHRHEAHTSQPLHDGVAHRLSGGGHE